MSAPARLRLAPDPARRIAVVGGAGGIGRALVRALLDGGCRVAVLDLPASLERHPVPDGVSAHPLDATDADQVARAFASVAARHEALDGLALLAGFSRERMPVAETAPEAWDEVIEGNLRSAFLAARAAVPLLRGGIEPSMVLVSSGLAVKPTPGYGPYSAAKAGVLALTRLLAAENAPAIRVNAVAPSAVDTAFLRGGTGRSDETAAPRLDLDAYLSTIPLRRMAVPDDVVGPLLFLLGPASAYVTGQTLHVNGGLVMP